MNTRLESWYIDLLPRKEKGATIDPQGAESKHFRAQRLTSHYRKPNNHNHHNNHSTKFLKTASTETMETEKTAISQVTASPMKPGSEKGKVPLLRFTARGQKVVPNSENAATLTDLSERLSDLEYEKDHSFLKSLSLLVEAWYFSVFLWFQMVYGGFIRIVRYNLMIGHQLKKFAALVLNFLTSLLLAGLRLLMFGVTKGVAFD